MGKALPLTYQFQPDTLGARAPQSFRSGVTAPEHRVQGQAGVLPSHDSYHPLRDGDVALQEDAYWHAAFMHEPYYVAGRGYDQYRPAYAMGWQAAFGESAASFELIEEVLEHRWEAYDTSSLLDWSEVRDAVHGAWLRGRERQLHSDPGLANANHGLVLRPLWRLQLHTARDLGMLLRQAEPPPTAFVRQVVERHVRMLQDFAQELPQTMSVMEDWAEPFLRMGTSVHFGWMWMRSKVQDVSTERILQLCDEREQKLLALYPQFIADTSLASELSGVLHRQLRQLQINHAKLQWVRLHWMQRSDAV